MTLRIRLVILMVVVACVVLIVRQVRRRQIRARYLVLWMSLCLVVVPLVAIPNAADWISAVLGIYYPPATFLMAAIVILFLVTIDFSHEITKLDERTRVLAEELALSRLTGPVMPSPTGFAPSAREPAPGATAPEPHRPA